MAAITAKDLATAQATSFMLLCGKARAREITAAQIQLLRDRGCHADGAHTVSEYANALKDVVEARNRPDEIEALIVTARQLKDINDA